MIAGLVEIRLRSFIRYTPGYGILQEYNHHPQGEIIWYKTLHFSPPLEVMISKRSVSSRWRLVTSHGKSRSDWCQGYWRCLHRLSGPDGGGAQNTRLGLLLRVLPQQLQVHFHLLSIWPWLELILSDRAVVSLCKWFPSSNKLIGGKYWDRFQVSGKLSRGPRGGVRARRPPSPGRPWGRGGGQGGGQEERDRAGAEGEEEDQHGGWRGRSEGSPWPPPSQACRAGGKLRPGREGEEYRGEGGEAAQGVRDVRPVRDGEEGSQEARLVGEAVWLL